MLVLHNRFIIKITLWYYIIENSTTKSHVTIKQTGKSI
jgi:hypothetical protein